MEEHRNQAGQVDVFVGEEGVSLWFVDALAALELDDIERIATHQLAGDGRVLVGEFDNLIGFFASQEAGALDPEKHHDVGCNDRDREQGEDPGRVDVTKWEQRRFLSAGATIMAAMDTTQIEAMLAALGMADPAEAPPLADELTEELSAAIEPGGEPSEEDS